MAADDHGRGGLVVEHEAASSLSAPCWTEGPSVPLLARRLWLNDGPATACVVGRRPARSGGGRRRSSASLSHARPSVAVARARTARPRARRSQDGSKVGEVMHDGLAGIVESNQRLVRLLRHVRDRERRPFRLREWAIPRFVDDFGLHRLVGTIRYPGPVNAS
jgi:hypothetical protein